MFLTRHPCRGQQSIRELCHEAARENASQHGRAVGEASCPFAGLPQAPNLSSLHLINYPSCQHPFSCLRTLPLDQSVARLQLGPLGWLPFSSQYRMCVAISLSHPARPFGFVAGEQGKRRKVWWLAGRRMRWKRKDRQLRAMHKKQSRGKI